MKALQIDSQFADDAYSFGKQTSALWLYFILAIVHLAVKDKIAHLFFLTREGEFFIKVWNKIISNGFLRSSEPPVSLLEVSRISTYGPAILSSSDSLAQLFLVYRRQNLHSFLKSLNCYSADVLAILKEKGISENKALRLKTHSSFSSELMLSEMLGNDQLSNYVYQLLGKHRKLLIQYLRTKGINLNSVQKFGLVDIGWRGSIQDNLAQVLGDNDRLVGYYCGLKSFLTPSQKYCKKRGIFFDVNASGDEEFSPLTWRQPWDLAVFEMLTTSALGSVKGYVFRDKDIVPIRPINEDEQKSFYRYAYFYQKGVLDALGYWGDWINKTMRDYSELRPLAIRAYEKLCFAPPEHFKQALAFYYYEDEYGLGKDVDYSKIKICEGIPIKQGVKNLFSNNGRKKLRNFARAHKDIYSIDLCQDMSEADKAIWKGLMVTINSLYLYVLKR